MTPDVASSTARRVAAQRALHQSVDAARIFRDETAEAIADAALVEELRATSSEPAQRNLRLFVCARSRFAEDRIAIAVENGARQVVILGAGLDTFSLRNPFTKTGVVVFEVDHPATQALKQARLAERHLHPLGTVRFVPVDFEIDDIKHQLEASGWNPSIPTVFVWLGVAIYLARTAISAVFNFVGSLPGSEIILDYAEPIENYPMERRAAVQAIADRVAALGEPWVSYFDPAEIRTALSDVGFTRFEDLGTEAIMERYLGVTPTRRGAGPHVLWASK
jgi:methyltransferase (TIGR00027 family)